MLTISKPLSAGQAQTYHKEEFANAQENYYSEGDRIHGEWHGRLAQEWGLRGEVQEEHFQRLANGQHPLTAEQLVRHQTAREYVTARGETVSTMEHRAGWDATFSAPKSVSLTALVGGDEAVRQAHRDSVKVALNEMERFVQARMGGNRVPETTGKWIATSFEHDSARPVNGYAAPQLHTHVVFFNLTETKNAEARALQPHELYRSQSYGTAIYRSELALRLEGQGYEIERGKSGQPEIVGYTRAYLDASSPRSQQIQAYLEQQGVKGAGAAQIAAHQTRDDKLPAITHSEMQRMHKEMAERFGNQPEQVIRAAHSHKIERNVPNRRHLESALTYAQDKNLERHAVTDERDLMRDALKRSMGEAAFREVRESFEKRIDSGRLIEVESRSPARAFTTERMIHYERDNVTEMRRGQGQQGPLVSPEAWHAVQQNHTHLSTSQRVAVEQILTTQDKIVGLEGVAGAGKTTSLTAVREAAEREGYQVVGLAPTSRAAHKLGESGIESHTLQRQLIRNDVPNDGQKRLFVIDESSLASTKQMNEFFHRLRPPDRVLLVGDTRQHEAVESGRPYKQLQEAGMETAKLNEILRQKDPTLKEAVEQLARGDVHGGIANLEKHGRVHEIVNPQERLNSIAREYSRSPEGTLVISPDNESRRELNSLIHRELQNRGDVSKDEHKLRVLESRQEMTGADRQWAGQYEPGDVLRYSRGSKTEGIKPGEYARVTGVDAKENRITIERETGTLQTYDPRRLSGVSVHREAEREFSHGDRVQFSAPSRELHVANRDLGTVEHVNSNGDLRIRMDSGQEVRFNVREHPHLDHGYAVTSHSSQGQTADRVLIHVDTEKSELLVNNRFAYVSVSRAQHDAHIYTNDGSKLSRSLSRESAQRTATEVEQELAAPKAEPASQRGGRPSEEEQGHSLGLGLA
ncbi:MAG: relaxase domain-containing protein [Acidobacteriia bacterium]|nr:relaxase domain-containing protein [Terriglobia bacterium]